MRYDHATNKWGWLNFDGSITFSPPTHKWGAPLVLIPGWEQPPEASAFNSGFTEAAADASFASLVALNQSLENTLFNSPMHFMGFGQGTAIDTEIVQRLGTYFPLAGGTSHVNRDLQMTTIDPDDFEQDYLLGTLKSFRDPSVRIWENVTYADNYYQDVPTVNTQETNTRARRRIAEADWNVHLGGSDGSSRIGFTEHTTDGKPHIHALTWYGGTANLSGSQLPSRNGEKIYRRLGDLLELDSSGNPTTPTRYTPDRTNANFTHGEQPASWEGIGTGWFYSVLGGGSQLRPYDVNVSNRVPLTEDNTYTDETIGNKMRAVALNIPVGNPAILSEWPESIAATNNATRAYVTMRNTGRVSVMDLMALREIDTTGETATVDGISLPDGARPQAVVIDPRDNYAYIADQNLPKIYVLDINPNSATYHTVVNTINVTSPLGLSQLAISSDGRRLFATGSDNNETTRNRNIYAVNIDPADKPSAKGANSRLWHQQIGVIPTASETEGIAATSDPKKMVFTNGFASIRTISSDGEEIKLQDDGKGFGVLEIESDDPLNFRAAVSYAPLSLGVPTDYFDVNEAVAVTVTPDRKYAFVAGRNSRANVNTREGGNIGIIKDPLGPNPQLVAATRPIPDSLPNNLALSSDGKYLIASYPTANLGGNAYVFNVEEMIKAIENPGNYKLDARDRGVGTAGFGTNPQRNATIADLARVPIDDINPLVSIAADYEITGGNWINNFAFSVPEDTNRAPIGIGGNPKGLAVASTRNWLELKGPIGTSESDSNPLTPTFKWDFKGEDDPCGLPDFKANTDVKEVNLYVSVFPEGKGLLPDDKWEGLNSTDKKDYNPNRILTAKWEPGGWAWNSQKIGRAV